jgi:hypothetical protein
MPITINDKLKDHINLKGRDLLKSIVVEKIIKKDVHNSKQRPTGYLEHKNIIDFGEAVEHMDSYRQDGKRLIEKYRSYKEEKIGYGSEGFVEIYKLVASLLKEDSICRKISEGFLPIIFSSGLSVLIKMK